ncbi:MAG: EamA family transporter [Anaerotruncus rubiinfantis]
MVLITLSGGSFGAGFNFTGDGFVIIAAISFSVGFVISKNVSANGDSVMISGWQLMIGGVGLLAVGLAFGGSLNVVTAGGDWPACLSGDPFSPCLWRLDHPAQI